MSIVFCICSSQDSLRKSVVLLGAEYAKGRDANVHYEIFKRFTSELIGKHRIRSHRNPAFPSIVIDIIPRMRGTPCDEGDG